MTIGPRVGESRGLIWEKLRNKSNYAKTGGPIEMILEHVAEMVSAGMLLKFVDNRPKGR